ncbi:MAG: deiodinase-like protein [Crocinitomicaceae bacterium]
MKRIVLSTPFFFLLLIAFSFLTLMSSCSKEQIEPLSEETAVPEDPINLLPVIGPATLPMDTDSICSIPFYLGDFDSNALEIGCPVPDFTLFDPTGTAHNLRTILEEGKPVFIMSGNITCPVFRSNVANLNDLIANYGDSINFYLAYSVEAHPENDLSPYSGTVWPTNANISSGVLFDQPQTYGERLDLIDFMLSNVSINCDILVDGPCNDYWLNYGEAPNRAYLIDPTGKVVISHGWFDYSSMITSIDAYLGF